MASVENPNLAPSEVVQGVDNLEELLVSKASSGAVLALSSEECTRLEDFFTLLNQNWRWMTKSTYDNLLMVDFRQNKRTDGDKIGRHALEVLKAVREANLDIKKAQGFKSAEEYLRTLGKYYLAIQRLRVAMNSMLDRTQENTLLREGLARIEVITDKDSEEVVAAAAAEQQQRVTKRQKTKLIELDPARCDTRRQEIAESPGYRMLYYHKRRFEALEQDVKRSAEKLFENTKLWAYCERVKGLGVVAALTAYTIINSDKVVDKDGVGTAGRVWSYLGLMPGQGLQRGQMSNFNPHLKGRTWHVSTNLLKSQDPYYVGFYKMQKEYYRNRPDLIAFYQYNKKKGFNARTHAMALRYIRKLWISHSVQIYVEENGYRFSTHRNYIPIKPEFEEDQNKVLYEFEQERLYLLRLWNKAFHDMTSGNDINQRIIDAKELMLDWYKQTGLQEQPNASKNAWWFNIRRGDGPNN